MLPYQEDRELETLLESLFEDDDDNDIVILGGPIRRPVPFSCCTLSYGSYSD